MAETNHGEALTRGLAAFNTPFFQAQFAVANHVEHVSNLEVGIRHDPGYTAWAAATMALLADDATGSQRTLHAVIAAVGHVLTGGDKAATAVVAKHLLDMGPPPVLAVSGCPARAGRSLRPQASE